jgi:peroxiredoxin
MLRTVSLRLSALALVALASACGGAGPEPTSGAAKGGIVGSAAPDFRVKPVAGARAPISLAALRGHVVLVDFWGTFCEPCKKSFPKLQAIHTKYSASGLAIIGVSEDEPEDRDKIPVFADTYGAKFALAWDADKAIAQRYRPETMPSSFVIDKQGVVRYAHAGYHDGEEAQLDQQIRELLTE